MPPRNRSRQKREKEEDIYCRKCMQYKPSDDFFAAVNTFLDSNGKMSICSQCCEDIFNSQYALTKNLSGAIYNTCKILDIYYSKQAASGLETKINSLLSGGKKINNVFGFYKMSLSGTANMSGMLPDVLTFIDEGKANIDIELIADNPQDQKTLNQLIEEWGEGRTEIKDYVFLEKELVRWKSGYEYSNVSGDLLLREICWKSLEIREARKSPKADYKGLVKQLQELITVAGLSPKDMKSKDVDGSKRTIGNIIKEIEQNEPAEIFGEERDAFKDWQGIEKYFENYVTRPLRNFVLGSRDFSIEEPMEDSEEEEDLLSHLSDSESED